MDEPIRNGLSDDSTLKDLSPAAERQISGNNRTHHAMSCAKNLEEETGRLFVKREEAQFVANQQRWRLIIF